MYKTDVWFVKCAEDRDLLRATTWISSRQSAEEYASEWLDHGAAGAGVEVCSWWATHTWDWPHVSQDDTQEASPGVSPNGSKLKNEENDEEAFHWDRSEGHSSCAHRLPDRHHDHELHGLRTNRALLEISRLRSRWQSKDLVRTNHLARPFSYNYLKNY